MKILEVRVTYLETNILLLNTEDFYNVEHIEYQTNKEFDQVTIETNNGKFRIFQFPSNKVMVEIVEGER